MELSYVYATAAVIVAYFVFQAATRKFDPFAPVWLFLVGYIQLYVVQAISYQEWAVQVRGTELVAAANGRSLWALLLFLAAYHCGGARLLAARLPRPPQSWSPTVVGLSSPLLLAWGLYCSGLMIRANSAGAVERSAELALLGSFPFVLLVAAVLLIVTGRQGGPAGRPVVLWLGLGIAAAYVVIWMFNAKRSHSLMGVLVTLCAFYITKLKRPKWPVLIGTAFVGVLVVALAINWRNTKDHERSFSGFTAFVSNFSPAAILECLNVHDEESDLSSRKLITHETEEYGGFLLMMDTVPSRSEYDYGASYLRVVSTFIPRVLWPDKPFFGREQWINAWIAGSELKRDSSFTGPAIGLLGAAQLNGGAWATAIIMVCLALLLRVGYEYFRAHAASPWVQAFWATTYCNAWFMVVCDDPLVWFYYNWGFTCMPILTLLWVVNQFAPAPAFVGHSSPAVVGATG